MPFQIGAGPGESGTTVKSQDGGIVAERSPFGTTLAVGAFEWGKDLVVHPGVGHFASMRGDVIEEDHTPTCCKHFYQAAAGKGQLVTHRLYTSDATAAYRDIYGRDLPTSFVVGTPFLPPARVMRMSGLYVGRRGGQSDVKVGLVADLSAALSIGSATFATGVTMVEDQFLDASLQLEGYSRAYRVTANSTAGLLSIEIPAGTAAPAAVATYWTLTLAVEDESGRRGGFGFQVGASDLRKSDGFSLDVYDERAQATLPRSYDTLVLDSTDELYVEQLVNVDGAKQRQHWLSAAVETLADPLAKEHRPAQWVGHSGVNDTVTNSLDMLTHFWERTSPGVGNAYVDPSSIAYASSDDAQLRMRALCTFTAAAVFTVQFQTWNGDVNISDPFLAEALGVAVSFAPTVLPSFTLIAGATPMAADDTIVVYFNPLPASLKTRGGTLYPFATDESGGDPRTGLPVRSNTAIAVTLGSTVDLEADHTYASPEGAGAPDGVVTAGPYNLTVAGDRDFSYALNGAAPVTLTSLLVGAAETAADLAVDLQAIYDATAPAVSDLVFGATTAGALTVSTLYSFGPTAVLEIKTLGMGAVLGYVGDTELSGVERTPVALSYTESMERGLDGLAGLGNNDEYLDAFDLSTSPLLVLDEQSLGLIKVMMPGVSGGTETDQNAAIAFCSQQAWKFNAEIDPDDAPSVSAAAIQVKDNLSGAQVRQVHYDAYGYPRRRPFKGQEILVPMTGAILGMQARLATDLGGYHIAPAGKKADIGSLFGELASTSPRGDIPSKKNERTLNLVGVSAVQQVGPTVYPNGGRNSEDAYAGPGVWNHKVDSVLHILHQLKLVGDAFAWEDNSPATRQRLQASARPFLNDLWLAGWFARDSDEGFDDLILISAGDDLNPLAVQVLGEMRMSVELVKGIVNAVERVVITLGTGGVAASFGNV